LAILGTVILALGTWAWWLASSPVAELVAAAVVLALAQAGLSSYTRTFSYRNWAVWFDGLAIHATILVALLFAALSVASTANVAIGTMAFAALVVAAAAMIARRYWQPDFAHRLRVAVLAGAPLLAYSLCGNWAIVAPRVYLGMFLPTHDVASFSVCFRAGSLILVLHVVLATGLFAKLYTLPLRLYDRYVSVFLVAIAAICLILVFAFPPFLRLVPLRAVPYERMDEIFRLFPVVMLLVFGWQAWALLEMRIVRVRRASQVAWGAGALFVLVAALIGLLAAFDRLTAVGLTWLAAVQMLGGVGIQTFVLWRRGAKMLRTIVSIAVMSLGLALAGVVA
jgi:hypothetical protein